LGLPPPFLHFQAEGSLCYRYLPLVELTCRPFICDCQSLVVVFFQTWRLPWCDSTSSVFHVSRSKRLALLPTNSLGRDLLRCWLAQVSPPGYASFHQDPAEPLCDNRMGGTCTAASLDFCVCNFNFCSISAGRFLHFVAIFHRTTCALKSIHSFMPLSSPFNSVRLLGGHHYVVTRTTAE
jgi:hypothetical protein